MLTLVLTRPILAVGCWLLDVRVTGGSLYLDFWCCKKGRFSLSGCVGRALEEALASRVIQLIGETYSVLRSTVRRTLSSMGQYRSP